MAGERRSFSEWLLAIDRRLVYLLVLLALAAPLCLAEFAPYTARKMTMKPAPLIGARKLFDRVERIVNERQEVGAGYRKIVLLVVDFGPQTRAELHPMLECTVRHLMMRRIKFAVFTNVPDGAGYCKDVPEKLARELGCEYGQDWANFGFKPGGSPLVRQMAANLPGAFKTDANGDRVENLPCMKGVSDAGDVSLVIELTGLVGMFNRWPAFFATPTTRPDIAHGCTSVSIPDAFSDLESGLTCGLFEGIAGAAAYNDFIEGIRNPEKDPPTDIAARIHMTSQTVAHMLVIVFVALGNIGVLLAWWTARRRRAGA